MYVRLVDFLKAERITALMTNLTSAGIVEATDFGISSLVDTWFMVRNSERGVERTRWLYVLKSRGMAHSNQLREFELTSTGIKLLPVYVGPGGVLTGSSRVSQESREREAVIQQQQENERKRLEAERRRLTLQAQVTALQAQLDAVEAEEKLLNRDEKVREEQEKINQDLLAKSRGV